MSTKELMANVADSARAIVDRAEKEKRDFTPAERDQIEDYRKQMERLKGMRIREQDAELRAMVTEMFPGMGDGAKGAKGPGPWAKAFDAAREQFGEKALISPSGSVGVPGPISVLAPLSGRVDTILQLIPAETIGSDAYVFSRETVRTHNAAPVATGALKPTSVYAVERVEATVRTIAHLSEPIPRSYLADMPLLQRYLDSVLREGLQLALEEQVITGSGVAPDLEGILSTEGVLDQPFATDTLTTCRKAVTALELYNNVPDAWAFHPSDWEALELLTSSEHYLMGQGQGQALPIDRATRRLWGYPVALSLGIPQGTAILADFAGSTHLWEREGVAISWSENVYHSDPGVTDFQRNMIMFRAEGRWGFAVTRPSGVCVVDLEAGS